MAMVVGRPGAAAEALMSQVKAMKGGPHPPKRIEFVDALPLTGVGKVDMKALRSAYWANQDRMVG